MSEHQADWVESIELFGQWGADAQRQAEAMAAWADHVEGE